MLKINFKIKKPAITLETAARVTFMIFVMSFLVQFYISNRYAVKNDDLQECIEQLSALQKELAELEYENSILSSLERVETEAQELGFRPLQSSLMTIGPASMAALVQN